MEFRTEPLPFSSPSGPLPSRGYPGHPPEHHPPPTFCSCTCFKYFCGCNILIIIGLVICLGFVILLNPIGLIFTAITPSKFCFYPQGSSGVVILSLTYYYYKDCVTIGQMTVSFLETIMWMLPLLVWDLIWVLAIDPQLQDGGLCGLCILAYILQAYFFAGFCEEVVKFKVISRLVDSQLTTDWRTMMVYGLCSGCGFATAENLGYVLSLGYPTGIVRAFTSVPLHCCTGAIIGLQLSRQKPLSSSWVPLARVVPSVLFIPWLIHGSYDFFLFLGPNIHNDVNVLVFILAFTFYIFGLLYVRNLSIAVWKEDSVCGEGRTVNIHHRIFDPEVPLIGQSGIHQWGQSSNYVCSCCFVCQCCCRPPSYQNTSELRNGISLGETYSPRGFHPQNSQTMQNVPPDEIYVYA